MAGQAGQYPAAEVKGRVPEAGESRAGFYPCAGGGYGKAEKHQVMEMTRQLLGLAQIPKPDDAADALAIAICHGHSVRWG